MKIEKMIIFFMLATQAYYSDCMDMNSIVSVKKSLYADKNFHDPFDVLKNDGTLIRELMTIERERGLYCPSLYVAEKTLAALLDTDGEYKNTSFFGFYCSDKAQLISLFGVEAINVARELVERNRQSREARDHISFGGSFQDASESFLSLVNANPSILNAHFPLTKGKTLMHLVLGIRKNNNLLKKIIAKANPNVCDEDNRSPLFYAIDAGRSDQVKILLKHNASVDIIDCAGCVPLHYAACGSREEICTMLCQRKPNLKVQNCWGDTPLHKGLKNNISKFSVKILLQCLDKNSCGFTLRNKAGESVVDLCIKYGAREIEQLLRNDLSERLARKMQSAQHKCREIALLLDNGAGANTQDMYENSALYWAIEHACERCMQVLINNKAEIALRKWDGETLLHRALSKKFHQGVDLLLAAGACIKAKDAAGNMPLDSAIAAFNVDGVKKLLSQGALVGANRLKIKHHCFDSCEIIEELLKTAYENQRCCMCCDNQDECVLDYIPCNTYHANQFICRDCYNNKLCTEKNRKVCPLCNARLDKLFTENSSNIKIFS